MFKIIRISDAQKALGCSRTAIYRYIKENLLPPPFRLGDRAVCWPETEITLIQAARCAGKSDDEMRTIVKQLIDARTDLFSVLTAEVNNEPL